MKGYESGGNGLLGYGDNSNKNSYSYYGTNCNKINYGGNNSNGLYGVQIDTNQNNKPTPLLRIDSFSNLSNSNSGGMGIIKTPKFNSN